MSLVNVDQERQDFFHFLGGSIGVAHDSCQLTFCGIVSALGLVQDFVFGGWDGLSLQQADNIWAGSVRNGQIEGSVVVVVLLGGSGWVGIVQGLDNLEWSVVVGGIMQGKVSVVVLLGGSFWVNLQQEFFDLEGSLLPGSKVERKVSVIVCNGSGFWVGLKKRLCNQENKQNQTKLV